MNDFLSLSSGRIHYRKLGNGPNLMLALHGFAQSATVFSVLEKDLAESCTIYAIDLPFHGQTEWHLSTYDPKNILDLIDLILEKEKQKTFYLLGHSLGGRIWLSCLDSLLSRLDGVFLLAPDGLATKGMLLPDAIPTWGRIGLAKAVEKPGWLLKLAYGLRRHRLLSPFAHQYLQYHFRSDDRKQRIVKTWISLGKFQINLNRIKGAIETKKRLKIFLFIGEDDQIIASDRIRTIVKAIPQMELVTLPGGHQIINQDLANEIKKRLE